MKKVGIIRCQQTEDMCPGTGCFKAARGAKGAFAEYGECEVVGMITCGGCPGKRAIPRAAQLVERGAEIIAFSSCTFHGTPIGFSCPHAETMCRAVRAKVGENIIILDHTH